MMKRFIAYTAAAAVSCSALAASHAMYVKQNDGIHRYSFGVAGDLKFKADGTQILVTGYEKAIDLTKVEYITFDMPTDGQLTSTEQKDRLLAIGEELNSKINANDAADIVGFGAEYDNLGYLDEDALFETFRNNHPDLFEDENDYNYYANAFGRCFNAMGQLAKGNFAASRTVGAVYTELFTRADFNGVFTPDFNAREWVKIADADYFEIKFTGRAQGKEYSFKVQTSEEYTEWSEVINIKEWDGSTTSYDVTGHAPKTITGIVTMNGNTIFSATVSVGLNQAAKSIDITTNATCASVNVEDVLAVRNTSATDNLTVRINNEVILTNNVNLTGSQLLNVPEWAEDMQGIVEEWEDEWYDDYTGEHYYYHEYYYDMDGRKIVRKFGSATTNTDILGKLQVQGHIANYDKSYDDLDEYINKNDDAYERVVDHDKHTYTRINGSEYWCGKIASVINNYTDASFYYDGKSQPQGFIDWKVYEDIDDDWGMTDGYWDDEIDDYVELPCEYKMIYIDYNIVPYLTFADGSAFAFDSTYFTGSNFQKLVDDAEDIADIINNILSGYEYRNENDH